MNKPCDSVLVFNLHILPWTKGSHGAQNIESFLSLWQFDILEMETFRSQAMMHYWWYMQLSRMVHPYQQRKEEFLQINVSGSHTSKTTVYYKVFGQWHICVLAQCSNRLVLNTRIDCFLSALIWGYLDPYKVNIIGITVHLQYSKLWEIIHW